MEAITEFTILQVGNKIHAPKLGKDFVIIDYKYNEAYKQMVANLAPTDKNGKGFTITFNDLIILDYHVY